MDACHECGYVYADAERDEIGDALRDRALDYAERLARDADDLRAHPLPRTWSVLEYACHVRDVFGVQRSRIRMALEQDEPTFPSMRREERVSEERYNEQDPTEVAHQLQEAAGELAGVLEELDEAGWSRTGVYNWPETQVRSVEWIGRHTLHEAVHHLMDIDRLLAAGRKQS